MSGQNGYGAGFSGFAGAPGVPGGGMPGGVPGGGMPGGTAPMANNAFVLDIPPDPSWQPYQAADTLEKDGYYRAVITKESPRASGDKRPGIFLTLEIQDEDARGRVLSTFLQDPRASQKNVWFVWRQVIRSIMGSVESAQQGFRYTPGSFQGRTVYVKTAAYVDGQEQKTGVDTFITEAEYAEHVRRGSHRWPPNVRSSNAGLPAGGLPGGVPNFQGQGFPGMTGGLPGAPMPPTGGAPPMAPQPMAAAPMMAPPQAQAPAPTQAPQPPQGPPQQTFGWGHPAQAPMQAPQPASVPGFGTPPVSMAPPQAPQPNGAPPQGPAPAPAPAVGFPTSVFPTPGR